MALCVKCGKNVTCGCLESQPIGEGIFSCPHTKKPGAIWVHVTDDAGQNVADVPVKEYDKTNPMGLTIKDNQSTGDDYKVELGDLEKPLLEKYDPPKLRSKDKVSVREGAISYVSFILNRKAQLEVEFVWKSKRSERFPQKPKIKITYAGDGTAPAEPNIDNGYADMGMVSAGKYTLTPDYSVITDQTHFDLDTTPQDFTLSPGEAKKTVTFLVEKKVQLEVEFVWKNDIGKRFLDFLQKPKVGIGYKGEGTAPTDQDVDKGYSDLGWVSAGDYVLTPDYTSIADPLAFVFDSMAQRFTLKPDDAKKTVKFPVEKKAKLKVKIVWKPDSYAHYDDIKGTEILLPGGRKAGTNGTNDTGEEKIDDIDVVAKLISTGKETTVQAKKGFADFDWMEAGDYEVTVKFSQLKPWRYDWKDDKDETRMMTLNPGDDKEEKFEVEPLYWKVEFFAHVLLTIPDKIYEFGNDDLTKLKHKKDPSGKIIYETMLNQDGNLALDYNTRPVKSGEWTWGELSQDLKSKASFLLEKITKQRLLTFKEKQPGSGDRWTATDLRPEDKDKIKLTQNDPNIGHVYNLSFEPKFVHVFYEKSDLTGTWKSRYHGYPQDDQDITARVALLRDTIDKAWEKSVKEPTVLKVFMVPECYFQGLHGAYLTHDKDVLISKLVDLVKEPKWKDWVFGFGTVNSVKDTANDQPPIAGVTYANEIYEMQNHAPVIRGGIGSTGNDSTRLILKALNSAELVDEDELFEDPTRTRTQAVNEHVQFVGDQEDKVWEDLLVQLLADNNAETLFNGLAPDVWIDQSQPLNNNKIGVREELLRILGQWGISRTVRAMRTAWKITDLGKAHFAVQNGKEHGNPDPKGKNLTLEEAACRVIFKQWLTTFSSTSMKLDLDTWKVATNREEVRNAIENDSVNAAKACGFMLSKQVEEIKTQVNLICAHNVSPEYMKKFTGAGMAGANDAADELAYQPSIWPIWKELMKIYAAKKGLPPLQTYEKAEAGNRLKQEDYVFAGPRKAGAWYPSLSKVLSDKKDNNKSCKHLVLGAEICADHPANRVYKANNSAHNKADPLEIDIVLFPSAGMTVMNDATRSGGFTFNCDGWNQKPPAGGRAIEWHFNGPSPIESNPQTPVYPHSVLVQHKKALTPNVLSPGPDKTLCMVIFSDRDGCEGELHHYEALDLPH